LIERHFEEAKIKNEFQQKINEEVAKVLAKLNNFDQTPIH
jgi:hypothetical protein